MPLSVFFRELVREWDVAKSCRRERCVRTAFLCPGSAGCYELKWSGPAIETDLCGHATLASAVALFQYYDQEMTKLKVLTASGELSVIIGDGLLSMKFPARPPVETCPLGILTGLLRMRQVECRNQEDCWQYFEMKK